MNELIAISAVVADRSYRIKVSPKDEEVVRKTLKTINDRIMEFKTTYAGKDMQDYIAMVLLWYATEKNSGISGGIEIESITEQLESIEKLIDYQLSKS